MRRHSPHLNRRERGYALLVTLVMLALLGVILGGLARRSADTALSANEAEAAMRHQWALRSCTYTLLTTAPDRGRRTVTGTEGLLDGALIPNEVFHLQLAGLQVWGRIDDEQSKLNLNHALNNATDASVSPQAVIDRVLDPERPQSLRLTREPFVQQFGLPRIMTWEQVFPNRRPDALLGIDRPDALLGRNARAATADRITLWGDGRLSIRTASNDTIRRSFADSVSSESIEHLLGLRKADPTLGLDALIANATAERKQDRKVLAAALIDQSSCYSLWLAVRSEKQQGDAADWSLRVLTHGSQSEAENIDAFDW